VCAFKDAHNGLNNHQSLKQQQRRSRVGGCKGMTQAQKEAVAKVFTNVANKQLDFDTVVGNVAKALVTDVLTADWVKHTLGDSAKTEERKHFRNMVSYFMPHYVLNGTDKVIACDFIAATDSNRGSKTIKQYRLSVDAEVVKPEGCLSTSIKTKEEQPQTIEFKHPSGYKQTINLRDADGNVITKSVEVELVPRKKCVWGYTKDVKTAIINAIEYIENEK
jgi:hypothetical protein